MDNDLALPEDMSCSELMRLQAKYITQHGHLELQRSKLEVGVQSDAPHKIQRIGLYLEQLERNIQLIDRRLDHTRNQRKNDSSHYSRNSTT